jgi:hypothetical protein
MKKLLLSLSLLAIPGLASAQWHHHGGYYRSGTYWVAPALVGGVIGYELARPAPQPSVVYVQPSPTTVYVQPSLGVPPLGYHWQTILDGQCNCYRNVLIPN